MTDFVWHFRADMVCHWEDSDVVIQEIFSNVRCLRLIALTPHSNDTDITKQDSLMCICIVFAIRTFWWVVDYFFITHPAWSRWLYHGAWLLHVILKPHERNVAPSNRHIVTSLDERCECINNPHTYITPHSLCDMPRECHTFDGIYQYHSVRRQTEL